MIHKKRNDLSEIRPVNDETLEQRLIPMVLLIGHMQQWNRKLKPGLFLFLLRHPSELEGIYLIDWKELLKGTTAVCCNWLMVILFIDMMQKFIYQIFHNSPVLYSFLLLFPMLTWIKIMVTNALWYSNFVILMQIGYDREFYTLGTWTNLRKVNMPKWFV